MNIEEDNTTYTYLLFCFIGYLSINHRHCEDISKGFLVLFIHSFTRRNEMSSKRFPIFNRRYITTSIEYEYEYECTYLTSCSPIDGSTTNSNCSAWLADSSHILESIFSKLILTTFRSFLEWNASLLVGVGQVLVFNPKTQYYFGDWLCRFDGESLIS